MSTSAAVPDDLERYAAAGHQAVSTWAPMLPALAQSLGAARAALHRAALPPWLGRSLPPIDDDLRDALLDVAHLDAWVASVAAAFRAADAGTRGSGGSTTVDDDRLVVGWAGRDDAETQARLDARGIAAVLAGELAAPDPAGGATARADAAHRVPALAAVVATIAAHGHDADYAATLVNALGPQGVRRLLDAVNQTGVLADRGLVDAAHAFDGVAVPAAQLLGDADRSGRLAPPILAELLDLGVAADPSAAPFRALGLAGQADAEATTDLRRRALALVLSTGQLSSATAASAAGRILRSAPADPLHSGREGFTGDAFVEQHPDLALTETLTLGALLGDDTALRAFLADRTTGPFGTNLTALLQPARTVTDQQDRNGQHASFDAAVDARYQAQRVAVLDRGLVQLPALGKTDPATETATAVAVIDTVRRLTPGPALDPGVQRALALFVARFAPDIATAVDPKPLPDLPPGRLGALHTDDIGGFLTEISGDEPARRLLLAEGSALLHTSLAAAAKSIAAGGDFAMGTAVVANFFGALLDAARRAGAEAVAEHAAAVRALSVVITPMFDLVGYSVLNGGGTALAVTRSGAHAQSGSLAEQVAEHLVPDAEIADLSKLAIDIESAFLDQARRALFADDAARTALGGPASLAGLSPATVDAVYRAFNAPDPIGGNGSQGATASSRLRPIENHFTALFRTMVAFDEMADRLDHQPGTRTH